MTQAQGSHRDPRSNIVMQNKVGELSQTANHRSPQHPLVRRSSRSIRFGLVIFLLLMTFDGAIRKWLVPGQEQLIFIAKDALLFLLLALSIDTKPANLRTVGGTYVPPVIALLLGAYVFYVVLNTFNPSVPTVEVGIWGVKAHLLYAGLIVILPRAFNNIEELFEAISKVACYVVIPIFAISALQLVSPASAFINQQVRGGIEGVAYFGEQNLVRIAGPFSYIAGMADFIKIAMTVGLGIYLYGQRKWQFLLALGLVAILLPVTGSRSVILVVGIAIVFMLLGAVSARVMSAKSFMQSAIVILMLGIASIYFQDDAWQAIQERSESNFEEGVPRVFTAFTNAFEYFDDAGLAGFGTGTANLGAVALAPGVAPFAWLPFGSAFEEESGRIVIELGVTGWLVSTVLHLALVIWSLGLTFGATTKKLRAASLLTLPILALGLHQGQGVFAGTYMAVGYWFCAAVLAMAAREDRERRASGARLRRLPLTQVRFRSGDTMR